MKQKRLLIAVIFSLTILAISATIWVRYAQVKPLSSQPEANESPVVLLDDTSVNTSTRPTMTDEQKKQADAPGIKQPTVELTPTAKTPNLSPTTNSPKHDAIRASIHKEQTYYPLRTANDPSYASNWALQKMNAPAAWDFAVGSGETVVAVVDTGFGLLHEDLKDRWHTNNNEIGMTTLGGRCWTGTPQDKTNNDCDDDNNGYLDDWRGWNFSIGDNNPMAGRTNPTGAGIAHGTEVAGLVGAAGNNATGITTRKWQTEVMPLQVLSDDGPGYTSDVAAAIYYAVDNGADVINLSLGGSVYDTALEAATNYAVANNVVVVAAAGNCGTGNEDGCQTMPAGFMGWPAMNKNVIAVGASNSNDQRASFSSYGPLLDVMAPGSGTIVSPTWTAANGTSLYSGALYGTSYASPQVASLAALIKVIRPGSSINDITALLAGTATKVSGMNGNYYTNEFGHGVVNAGSALTVASSLNTTTATPTLLQTGGPVTEHRFASTDTLGSGCTSTGTTYCAVWLNNTYTGATRYLPYQLANQQGTTGWTWRAATLTTGEWQVRAVQGDRQSSAYSLSTK